MNGAPDAGRRVRSYVLRQGRITASQQKALDELLPRYSLDPERCLDAASIFGRDAPLFLEVGFGNGEALAHIAAERPDQDFIGVEVHPPGIGHLLLEIARRGLTNVRLYRTDAVQVLDTLIPDESLDGIRVFFPDPWPKKRHHKRRLINPKFISLAAHKLKPGGTFHAATDWEDYAEQMLAILESSRLMKNCSASGFSPRPDYRPLTKFERRGQRLGHAVRDLIFARITAKTDHSFAAAEPTADRPPPVDRDRQ